MKSTWFEKELKELKCDSEFVEEQNEIVREEARCKLVNLQQQILGMARMLAFLKENVSQRVYTTIVTAIKTENFMEEKK